MAFLPRTAETSQQQQGDTTFVVARELLALAEKCQHFFWSKSNQDLVILVQFRDIGGETGFWGYEKNKVKKEEKRLSSG